MSNPSFKQISFVGGLSAVANPKILGTDEVAASTNVDYSLQWGAAQVRRGSILYGSLTSGSVNPNFNGASVSLLARNFGSNTGAFTDVAIPWYAVVDAGTAGFAGASFFGTGTLTGGTGPMHLSRIGSRSGGIGAYPPVTTQYQGYIYIGNGTDAFRTNGTNTFDWLLPQADTPVVTFLQQSQFWTGTGLPFVGAQGTGTGTYSALEGTITGTSTLTTLGPPVVLFTCTSGTGTRVVLEGLTTSPNWENPTIFIVPPTGTGVSGGGPYTVGGDVSFHTGWPSGDTTGASGPFNGSSTSTQTLSIGNYGTDYLPLALFNSSQVVTIQLDLSIGDTSFFNYWHTETTPDAITAPTIDAVTALIDAQGNASQETQILAVNSNRSNLNKSTSPVNPGSPTLRTVGKTTISGVPSPWAISRGAYNFIGVLSQPSFTNIQAVRVIIEFSSPNQSAQIGGVVTYGGLGYPLNDTSNGISYYQTFARVENGVIVAEGAPSLPSSPQQAQFANGEIQCIPVTNTTAGITHRVFYRTGGLLQDAYRVGSCSIASAAETIYDYGLPDMLIINNPVLRRNLWSIWPSPTAGTGLTGVNAVSQPWQNRAFIGVGNQLYWSVPGVLTQIQEDSQTTVSDSGDNITGIHPGQNLVIVNQSSVFEMAGSQFEGDAQNWTLTRTGARRGSAAPKTCINTPYGILLFSYDGLSFYRQGWGLDQEQQWIYDKIGDLWKGTSSVDPANAKGRIPPLNNAFIFNACAAYKDEKIYLAVPDNGFTFPTYIFILDIPHQKVWMAQYGFNITSLYWDVVGNRLMAGTSRGGIVQLETGLVDYTPDGTTGIGWSFTTRNWSTPQDAILQNLQVESQGTTTLEAFVDGTSTITLGTLSAVVKDWLPASLAGRVVDNVSFNFSGTQSGSAQAVFGMEWDAIPETAKVSYARSEFAIPYEGAGAEGWFHKIFCDIDTLGTTTISATVTVDNILVGTYTITGLTGRDVYSFALPAETYGKLAFVEYNCAAGLFKSYNTWYEVTQEPTRVLIWESSILATPSENYVKTWNPTINPLGGTVTAQIQIDGTTVLSSALLGNRKFAYEIGLPNVTTGKTLKSLYTSPTPFKFWGDKLELEPKPFGKLTWLVTYKKAGGATQADMARFYAMDIEGLGTHTITNTWIIDGQVFSTNTLVFGSTDVGEESGEGVVRNYLDQIPFPPGARGYLFQQQVTSTSPFRVWRSSLDIDRIGVKGLSRVTLNGTPSDGGQSN